MLSACFGNGDGDGDGGGAGGNGAAAAAFTLSLDTSTLTVGQGREALLSVTLTRSPGFSDEVRVTLNQPAAGLSAGTLVFTGSLAQGSLPIRIDALVPVGSVLGLDVMATSGALSQTTPGTLTVSVALPHAQRLIADARAAGTLDEGTALLYRAYALFGDSRLPDALRGAGSVNEDNEVFDEIRARLPALPSAMQTQLRPFIVRPADPLSVWNTSAAARGTGRARALATRAAASPTTCPAQAAGSWISKRSPTHAVRAWAQCQGTPIKDLESEIDIDIVLSLLNLIYPSMTALMGPPVPDLDGDDDAIDFYIVDDKTYVFRWQHKLLPVGLACAYSDQPLTANGGNGSSGFVLIPRSTLALEGFQSNVIHEFFHVLQMAHNAKFANRTVAVTGERQKHWFVEASAKWSEAHFDRTLAPGHWTRHGYQFVHAWFAQVFQAGADSLNAHGDGRHDYSAYIWPYFVEQETGGPGFMGQIWFNLRGATTFEAADDLIDTAYPFSTHFKRFALRNLNTELKPGNPIPQDKRHVKLDPAHFPDKIAPSHPPRLETTLKANQVYNKNLELKNLSAVYLDLLSPDGDGSGIRKVMVDSSGLQPFGPLDVQALIETDAGWLSRPIDLGPKELFCFDEGPSTESVRGSFNRITLVLTNHAKRLGESVSGAIQVDPKSTPCAPVWDGTLDATVDFSSPAGTIKITSSAQVTFAFDEALSDGGQRVFQVRSGRYSYRSHADNLICRTEQTASGPMRPQKTPMDLGDGATSGVLVTFVSDDGKPQYTTDRVLTFTTLTQVSNCNDRKVDETTMLPMSAMALWALDHKVLYIKAEGATMEGSQTVTVGNKNTGTQTTSYTWLLTKKTE